MQRIIDRIIENCITYSENNAIHINNQYYSYAELLKEVHRIFSFLKNENITSDKIGIYCQNDFQTYASILAINQFGSAYVPLNSKFPIEYNQEIIKKLEIEYVLNSSENTIPLKDTTILNIKKTATLDTEFKQIIFQDYVYHLNTSGSTGTPKTISISNNQLTSLFNHFTEQNQYNFTEKDRFLQTFELTFDVSVFSFFMPLLKGACCYVLDGKNVKFIEIIKWIKEYEITILATVPTIISYLKNYLKNFECQHLKYSLFLGDKLLQNECENWQESFPNSQIVNLYGPTEATIFCSEYFWTKEIDDSLDNIIPIGKLFPNIEYVLIDENNQVNYDLGELCLRGQQVIKNYHAHENKECFIQIENDFYYKTGDLIQIRNNTLFFITRVDQQIKINGFRVELNAIENLIFKHFKLKTIAIKSKNESIICFHTSPINPEIVISKLKTLIPSYMIPSQFELIKEFPLNSNQKIDYKKLTLSITFK